jgi:hypothetical protein
MEQIVRFLPAVSDVWSTQVSDARAEVRLCFACFFLLTFFSQNFAHVDSVLYSSLGVEQIYLHVELSSDSHLLL